MKSKAKNKAPPPRAGFAVDAVLQRSGNVVDIRRIYVGPRDIQVEDLIDLLSAVVAVALRNSIKEERDLYEAKVELLNKISQRIPARGGNGAGLGHSRGREPLLGVEETPEAKE